MNFFIDFEANQFTNEIISIGCVAENGATFYALVKPISKKKPSKFITELTGITKEMLAHADTADKVFKNFYLWRKRFSSIDNKYYVYGNCDAEFCYKTLRKMEDVSAKKTLLNIVNNTIDFCDELNKRYQLPASIGLNKLYELCIGASHEQIHNALDDAKMLKYIYENINNHSAEEIKSLISPNIINQVNGGIAHSTYTVIAIDKDGNEHKFPSLNEASRFTKPFSHNSVKSCASAIKKSIINNEPYAGFTWKILDNF